MRVRIPFDSTPEQRIRAMRTRGREETPPELVGYIDRTGDSRGLTGDDVAPYFHPLGRASVTAEGQTIVSQDDPQRLLVTPAGILYTIPAPQVTEETVLVAEEEASADQVEADAIDVTYWRRLAVYITYTPGDAAGQLAITALANARAATQPSLAGIGVNCRIITALEEATPAAADSNADIFMRHADYKTPVSTDAAFTILTFDVTNFKWVRLVYGGDPGAILGTVAIDYNLAN